MRDRDDPPEADPTQTPRVGRSSILSHFLGEGLRVAFGPAPAPPQGRLSKEGVLDWLRRSATQSPAPTLRECGEEAPPPIVRAPRGRAPSERQIGPYTVMGEIARGGVGIIYQVRERNLGRDLALKVLQARHEDSPQLILRFIEEAQIASQLQHPGVVPIHELGEHDGLPYFTMKLVRGRTLAALLDERESPSERRSYFVEIFQKIVETLAYAHARGVIHRDTKPANIMVGAFGEVQVMDWGFAKVLAERPTPEVDHRRTRGSVDPRPDSEPEPRSADRDEGGEIETLRTTNSTSAPSDSLAGSVLGTPSYMGPEQARGWVDQLDERADVFGLGAILCEILTGEPPFVGESASEIHARAREANMEPVYRRLAASGADPELIRLATSCLSVEPRQRPRHAGLIAREVRTYVASLEHRAKAAELDAAGARVRADEAHKRRRLATATAFSIATLILVCAGGWIFLDRESRKHREAIASDIRKSLRHARELRDQAWSGDASKWELALTVAREAEDRAIETGDPALIEEVRGLVNDIAEVAEQESRVHDMLERLERANSQAGVPEDRELLRSSRIEDVEQEFASAFREFGIDVASLEPAGAALQIRESGISEGILAALDRWAAARLSSRSPSGDGRELLRIAQLADSSEPRTILRKWVIEHDRDAIREFVRSNAYLEPATATLLLLAAALAEPGEERQRALEDAGLIEALYLRAHELSPDDFAINFEFAEFMRLCVPPRWEESLPYYAAAVALRPDSVPARTGWARALSRTDRTAASQRAFDEAIRRSPRSAAAYTSFGNEMFRAKRYDEALEYFDRAIAVDPTAVIPRDRRASLFRGLERWREATEAYTDLVTLAPDHQWGWFWLGVCAQRWGDTQLSENAYREAIRRYPDFAHAHCNLAFILVETGHPYLAAESLELGSRLGRDDWKWAHDTKQWLDLVQDVVSIQKRLDAPYLNARQRAEIALEAARLCEPNFKGQCVRYYELARDLMPQERFPEVRAFRYQAVRAAASKGRLPRGAGTPSGDDAAAYRSKAATWLRELLDEATLAWRLGETDRDGFIARVQEWRSDPDLRTIRNPRFLGQIPDEERSAYESLWRDVELALAEAGQSLDESAESEDRESGR